MNWSVPLSPPLITAAATRIATISPSIAQNSVVLKAAFVSVTRRRALLSTLSPLSRTEGARVASDAAIAKLLVDRSPETRSVAEPTAAGGDLEAARPAYRSVPDQRLPF